MILKLATVLASVVLTATTQGISVPAISGVSTDNQNISRAVNVSNGFISPVSSNGSVETKVSEFQGNTALVSEANLEALITTAAVENIKTGSGEILAPEQAFASKTDQGYVILRIPFEAKPNLLEESGYSVFFDTSGKVVASGEIVLNQITEYSGRITMWQDGAKLVDTVVEDPNRPQQLEPGQAQTSFSWNRLNSCLANAGIAAWAITAIGVACGAACAATAGIGCIICATAVSGIAGGTIGTCVGKAMTA